MAVPEPVIVPPSFTRLLTLFLISSGGMIVGIFLLLGTSFVGQALIATVALLLTLNLLVALVRRRPRIEISPEGFTVLQLYGQQSRRWDAVHGEFVVIPLGWTKAVAYKLSPTAAEQATKKPAPVLQGNDAGISGAFALAPEQLAELLNSYARQVRNSES